MIHLTINVSIIARSVKSRVHLIPCERNHSIIKVDFNLKSKFKV